jgi:hypothetical protein
MTRISWIALFVVAASVTSAQQTSPSTEHTITIELQPKTPLNDNATLVSAVNSSYYHPDAMSNLACDLTLDWPGFLAAFKTDVPPERMKVFQSLKMRVNAQRGKTAELTFDWAGGNPNGGQEQVESGLKQMVGGFFQSYWSLAAATLLGNPTEIIKTEPAQDGSLKIYVSGGGASTVVTVDKQFSPTTFVVDMQSMKINMGLRYISSPQPATGDLRRLTGIDVDEQLGASNIKAGIEFDYQSAGEFFVPQHVLFNVPGAYSAKMEFSSCTATK